MYSGLGQSFVLSSRSGSAIPIGCIHEVMLVGVEREGENVWDLVGGMDVKGLEVSGKNV